MCGNRLTSLTPRICMILSTEAPAAAPGRARRVGCPSVCGLPRPDRWCSWAGWWSRVVVFPFLPGSREPVGAVKPWRTPGEIDRVEREQRGQGRIRTILPPHYATQSPSPLGSSTGPATSVPRSRALRDSGSWPAAIGTGGSPFIFGSSRAVSSWLTAFNTYGEIARRPWSDGDVATWFDRLLAEYRDVFGITEPEQRLAEAVLHRANELAGTTVPFVRCHNDFSELNVYCGAKSISVVDWEGLGPGLPARPSLLPTGLALPARRIANRERRSRASRRSSSAARPETD